MGAESGGTGAHPPVEKSAWDVPPEIRIFQLLFYSRVLKVCIFQHSQNQVAEIRGETKFVWGYVGLGAHCP